MLQMHFSYHEQSRQQVYPLCIQPSRDTNIDGQVGVLRYHVMGDGERLEWGQVL